MDPKSSNCKVVCWLCNHEIEWLFGLLHNVTISAKQSCETDFLSASPSPLLDNLHWLPLRERIQFKLRMYVYKCLHDCAPGYLFAFISYKSRPQTGPVTRSAKDTSILNAHIGRTCTHIAQGTNPFLFPLLCFGIASPRISGRHAHYQYFKNC